MLFVCVHFNCVLKLPAWMNAKSQWLHCFLHYEFSKCPSDMMHIHISCICVAFPQCEFLKLSSSWVHEWMQNHNDYICFEYHNSCFFFKVSFRYDIYSHWLHLGGFSPKVRFKSVLKLVAWVDAKLQWLQMTRRRKFQTPKQRGHPTPFAPSLTVAGSLNSSQWNCIHPKMHDLPLWWAKHNWSILTISL